MSLSILVDLVIIIVLGCYLYDGYRRGLLLLGLELLGTFLSFYLAFRWAIPFGGFLARYFEFAEALRQPLGFIALWFILQALYVGLSSLLYPLIPDPIRQSLVNRIGGVIPSFIKGLAMVSVILTLLVVMPVKNQLQPAVLDSRIGKPLVNQTQAIEQQLTRAYSHELTDTLTFLTTTPFTRKVDDKVQTVKLHFSTTDIATDPDSEVEMLRLINKERTAKNLKPLVADASLREVARTHAKDMLARGYFSHYSPEGTDPFDRMEAANIRYLTAGENLAFAPTVELAHIGLMNSPKHRDNILYAEFGHVGIGVIDGGLYGKMFVQEFSD